MINRKKLARTSSEPGKTRQINFYNIDDNFYFVDLPGYGFSKMSKKEQEQVGKFIEEYLFTREKINQIILLLDIRHKPTENDITMAEYFQNSQKPWAVVANKLDKLKKSEIEPNMALIRDTLKLSENVKVIPFSAEKGTGRETLLGLLEDVSKHV